MPVPSPDAYAEPESMVVPMDTGVRIHYLDWGGGPPVGVRTPPLVLIHGIGETAWWWAPIARRLRSLTHVVALDVRGHGASDAPASGYELLSLAIDVLTVMVANGWGPDAAGQPALIAGHGFGAQVAVAVAAERPGAVAGLALVDGGWEDVGRNAGDDPEQVVKALAEPPEVLRSMESWLADRRGFDPASWDADQERAARAQVTQKHAGHVVSVLGRAAQLASVTSMLSYRPDQLLPLVSAPVLLAVAAPSSSDDETARDRALELCDAIGLLRGPARLVRYPAAGHNLARYVPDELTRDVAALLAVASGRRPARIDPGRSSGE
jgi:pimeloyl-ACP methyl ester carboxylesterase